MTQSPLTTPARAGMVGFKPAESICANSLARQGERTRGRGTVPIPPRTRLADPSGGLCGGASFGNICSVVFVPQTPTPPLRGVYGAGR